MGMFDAFGVDAAEVIEPTFTGRKPGTYSGTVKGVTKEEGERKDGEPWVAANFIYDLTNKDGSTFEQQEFFFLPTTPASQWDDVEPLRKANGDIIEDWNTKQPITEKQSNLRALGALKQRMVAIGVPENKVNEVDPFAGHLDGLPVTVRLVENKKTGYVNISRKDGVVARKESQTILPTPTPVEKPAGFKPAWG